MNEPLGHKLKQVRLEKGLSLEEAQKKTRIHLNILRAIEGDSITNLNPVYLKGFLKIYCNFLGVDPKDYLGDYPQIGTPLKESSPAPSFSLKSFLPGKKIILTFIFILAAVFLAVGVFNLGKFIFSRLRMPPAKRSAAVLPAKAAKSQSLPLAVKKEVASGIRLTVSAKDNCLLYVKADGRVVFHRVLEKGRSETWPAKERIELDLGNAGAVELQVNEQRFPPLGRRGQSIKGIVISLKDGLKIPR